MEAARAAYDWRKEGGPQPKEDHVVWVMAPWARAGLPFWLAFLFCRIFGMGVLCGALLNADRCVLWTPPTGPRPTCSLMEFKAEGSAQSMPHCCISQVSRWALFGIFSEYSSINSFSSCSLTLETTTGV